jgi:hypothetical protein
VNKVVYFDVDETLILWNVKLATELNLNTIFIDGIEFGVHHIHVKKLIQHNKNGDEVNIWSAGGTGWAKKVIKYLELESYVTHVLSKPDFYYDDIPMQKFSSKRMYLNISGHMSTKEGIKHLKEVSRLIKCV